MSAREGRGGRSGGRDADLGNGTWLQGAAGTSRANMLGSFCREGQPVPSSLMLLVFPSLTLLHPKAKRFWLNTTRSRGGVLPSMLPETPLLEESSSPFTWTLVGCRR